MSETDGSSPELVAKIKAELDQAAELRRKAFEAWMDLD